ncbi:MAG: SPOR domain-containing protein [Betaproteobacteria bacterium]|nr:SPOR domain-containing protein [Betaproteobacteria bacterium]
MDLSYAAAKALGVASTGTAPVRIVAFQGDMAAQRPAPAEDAPVTQTRPEPPLAGATPSVIGAPPQHASDSQALFHPAALPAAQAQAVQSPGITVQALAPLQPSDSTGASSDPPPTASAAAQPPTPGATQDELSASEAVHVQGRSTAPPLQSYLQTGAFTVEHNAMDERTRLQTAGIGPVQIVPGLIHGQSYYRVQIGPLPAATPPSALEQKLQALGITSYSIVQD